MTTESVGIIYKVRHYSNSRLAEVLRSEEHGATLNSFEVAS